MKKTPSSVIRFVHRFVLATLAGVAALGLAQAQSFFVTPAVPNIPSGYTNFVTDYGAVSDGIVTNTAAINAAILDASSTNGGGTVIIPFVPGTSNIYICGGLTIKNKTRLQVQAGVILRMLPQAKWSGSALIFASAGASDIEVSGSGTLDGNAGFSDWWSIAGTTGKPWILNISGAARLLIKDVTLINSPRQHIVCGSSASTNITIQGITIATDSADSHNTDGIDVTGKNILIQDCKISCGDDNIAITSTSHDVLVTNCIFGVGHGMSFGSDTGPGGVTNILVTDCIFTNTDSGVRIKSDLTSGGPVFNSYFYNLNMTNVNNNAITVYGFYPTFSPNGTTPAQAAADINPNGSSIPQWHDVIFSNITATVAGSGNAGILWGPKESPLTNIILSHVNITAAKTFNVYNAYGVKFLDSKITTTTSGQKTLTVWNAGLVLSNTVSGGGVVTFDGLTSTTNSGDNDLALYNTKAAFTYTNLFGANPLSLSGSTLSVSNNLFLTNGTVCNFNLGTSNTLVDVRSNLTMNTTINVTAGTGFGAGIYSLFTYRAAGVLSGTPTLGSKPPGFHYRIDTATAGQVNLVVSNTAPVAGSQTFYRHSGQVLQIPLSALSASWSDADGDTISLLSNDTSSTNGATVAYDGVVTINYTNVNDVDDQFGYTITDNLGATNTGTVTVITTFTDLPPVATPVTVYRHLGQSLNVSLSTLASHWSDPEADPISFASVISPSTNGGTVIYDGVSTIAYNNANNVTDQFSYVITDNLGTTNVGLVNVFATNLPPTSPTVNVARIINQPLHVLLATLATNWSDPESDAVSFVSVTSPTTGGGTVVADGTSINYTNVANSADQISYTITDSFGATATKLINIQVVPPPIGIVALSPANGATNVCTDTPLRITFDAVPRFTNSGVITIYAVTNSVAVDTNDLSLCTTKTGSPNVSSRKIAGTAYFTFPIIVSGNTATIYPHAGVLATNQTYYVNITPSLFTNNSSGGFLGITDSNTWSFTTKATLPPAGTNVIEVAADGTGNFCTVQGAVDYLPASSSHVLVNIHKGIYQEVILVPATKNNITFRGEDRKQTMITYANNDNLNSGSSLRSMVELLSDDDVFENLTLTNSTPHGGSQAEALHVKTRRFICNNCDIDSYQDTLQVDSFGRSSYFYNCYIQGDVDFIWNDGVAVFQNCELKSLTSSGFNCQMRSDPSRYGAVFLDCMLTKATGVTGCYLNRIDPGSFPGSAAAFINCRMDTHIIAAGWQFNVNTGPTNNIRFWEYQSTNIAGTAAIDVSGRANFSLQLNAAQANAMRNLTNVFGANQQWLPQLLPNILSHPTNQTVNIGSAAAFAISATGIQTTNPVVAGDPSIIVPLGYQWFKNGNSLPGATNATLSFGTALHSDAGTYYVIASNLTGIAVSSNVTLTVTGNNAPTAAATTFYRHSGQPLNISLSTLTPNWNDVDSDTINFVSVNSPSTNLVAVTFDGISTINYTNANNVNDQFSYLISDNFGGTNTGVVNIIVTNLPPAASTATWFRNSGLPLQILVSDLATNWTDPEADVVSFVSVNSPSTNLATLTYDGVSTITYTSPHNLADQFTYTINDSFGATATGTVNVSVIPNPPANLGSPKANSDGSLTINFSGTPNVTYWVLTSTNVATPLVNWTFLSTNVAAPDGTWQLIDTNRTNFVRRFYRAVESY